MDAQTIVIQLPGSGPYGFRLVGGETAPLVVSKIRPYSKAQQYGICEGDIALAINGISCKGLKHSTATGLTESDSLGVTLHVLRGPGGHSENGLRFAEEELRGRLRELTDSEAARIVEASGHGPSQVIPASSLASDSPPDSPLSINSSSTPFKLQMPPSGGLKQMRNYRQQLSRESASSSPSINQLNQTSPAMSQQYGQLNLQRDLYNQGNPAGKDPGYYSRQEQTFQEGDTTRKVTEEVSKDKFGGTTVTRVVKQEVSNRQIPVNERVVFDQPSATFSVTSGGPSRFGEQSYPGYGQNESDDYYVSNQPVKVQTYNKSSNSWNTSSSAPQGGNPAFDFTTMIQELENSAPASWQNSSIGTNKGGNQHWNTTTSWTVGGGTPGAADERQRWNGSSGSTVEMRPGAEIQIQFQPQQSSGGQSRFEPARQSSYIAPSDSQYPFSGGASNPSMPVIQVYSSNDDRPHVQLQANTRAPAVDDTPYLTEVYETTRTKHYRTEEDGPVSVKSWSSSEPSASSRLSNRWDSNSSSYPQRIESDSNENSRQGDIIVRNESGSLSRSTSVQGAPAWNKGGPAQRQISQQGSSHMDGGQSSYSSWKAEEAQSSGYQSPGSGFKGQPLQSQKSYPGQQSQLYQEDDYSRNNNGFGTNQRAVPAGPGIYSESVQRAPQVQSPSSYQKQNSWSPASSSRDGYQADQNTYGSKSQQQGYESSPAGPQSGYQPSNYSQDMGYQQGYQHGYQGPQQGTQQGPQGYQSEESQDYQGYRQGPNQQWNQGYQQGPGGLQEGYGGPNQGYNGPNQGYGAPNQGYGVPNQGYGGPNQGYSGPNQGYGGPSQGYDGSNQGYGGPKQGYGGPNQGYGGPHQGYGGYQEGPNQYGGGYQAPPPPPPPAPMAPPLPPPPPAPSANKNLYGPQAVPERVQVAKVVAHSVLAPENSNSKGQQMFLRRMAQSEKWSTGAGDGSGDSGGYGGGFPTTGNTSSWGSQDQSSSGRYDSGLSRSQPKPQGGIGVGLTSEEMTGGGMGRGGQLFAKKKERADRWAAADDQRQQGTGRGRVVVGTAVPQQQQQQPSHISYQPMKMNVQSINSYSSVPSNQYGGGPSNQKYAYTDL